MLHSEGRYQKPHYRKEALKRGLLVTPNYLQSRYALRIEDFRVEMLHFGAIFKISLPTRKRRKALFVRLITFRSDGK